MGREQWKGMLRYLLEPMGVREAKRTIHPSNPDWTRVEYEVPDGLPIKGFWIKRTKSTISIEELRYR